MKLYILKKSNYIYGVFTTKEKAKEAKEEISKTWRLPDNLRELGKRYFNILEIESDNYQLSGNLLMTLDGIIID